MPFELRFTKGQGTGNDFVLFTDALGEHPMTPAQIRALCDRRFGVGADGIIRAVQSQHFTPQQDVAPVAGAGSSPGPVPDGGAQWFMDYWNADGTVSEMCGNGIRVFAAYLADQGLAELAIDKPISVGTRAGIRSISRNGSGGYRVDMGLWSLSGLEPTVRARQLPIARPGLGIEVGNPHVVVALANETELDQLDLTVSPVLNPDPAHGVNVEFVLPEDPLVVDGVGNIRMRVHERGSGETLSCGTGAVAAALAVRHWAGAGAPNEWRVKVPGGKLTVDMWQAEDGERVSLTGNAELVFDGLLNLG